MTTVKNGYSYNKNGWLYISIKGDAYNRGVAYGKLCAAELKKVFTTLDFLMYETTGRKWSFFIDKCSELFQPSIEKDFPEFLDEMRGIADGAKEKGVETSLEEIVAWNCYWTIQYWYPTSEFSQIDGHAGKSAARHGEGGGTSYNPDGAGDKCSAFIALGDYTEDGKIVMAHNTFDNFIDGQFCYIALSVEPSKGHKILMQTYPGWISSGTDFFVTSKKIIGTATIGGFMPFKNKLPICCRIRQCMQYGNSLDEYAEILQEGNSGDYANSWLFGDLNKNEIMRIELGLEYVNIEKKTNGYFIGFNAPYDPRIRNLECNNTGFYDIRRHQGARRVRLGDFMEEYKGKLNIEIAKKIISDHYDVYLNKVNPCSRTVCSHYDLDDRAFMSQSSRPKPYQPRGALDGKVIDSKMGKNMQVLMRYGSSCGMDFNASYFCNMNKQWLYQLPYLMNRPTQPWTLFELDSKSHNKTLSVRGKKNNKKSQSKKSKRPDENNTPLFLEISNDPLTPKTMNEKMDSRETITPYEDTPITLDDSLN